MTRGEIKTYVVGCIRRSNVELAADEITARWILECREQSKQAYRDGYNAALVLEDGIVEKA